MEKYLSEEKLKLNNMEVENVNPNVYKKCDDRQVSAADEDDNITDSFDEREIFGE